MTDTQARYNYELEGKITSLTASRNALRDENAGLLSAAMETVKLRAENKRLREAVEWYGERAYALTNYKDQSASYLEAVYVELSLDAGRRAREALKETDDA